MGGILAVLSSSDNKVLDFIKGQMEFVGMVVVRHSRVSIGIIASDHAIHSANGFLQQGSFMVITLYLQHIYWWRRLVTGNRQMIIAFPIFPRILSNVIEPGWEHYLSAVS